MLAIASSGEVQPPTSGPLGRNIHPTRVNHAALVLIFAALGTTAPAHAADHPTSSNSPFADPAVLCAVSHHQVGPDHNDGEAAAPASATCDATVLAALREGILLHGRPERPMHAEPPQLHVKFTRLPLYWFNSPAVPKGAHAARRAAPRQSWSSRNELRPVRSALALEQPGAPDVRVAAGTHAMPHRDVQPLPADSGDTILPAARWEEPPAPTAPSSRRRNPLRDGNERTQPSDSRAPLQPAKRNPLRGQ